MWTSGWGLTPPALSAITSSANVASAAALSQSITPQAPGSALVLAAVVDSNPAIVISAGAGGYVTGSASVQTLSYASEWAGTSSGPALTTALTPQALSVSAAAAGIWQFAAYEVLAASAPVSCTLTATVTDSVTAQTGTGNATFTVSGTAGSALAVTTAMLPSATAGVAYSASLTATGGTAPYSWAVSSGSLPAGLSLSSAGVISGTPATAGTAGFTVRATDSASGTATAVLSLTVAAASSGSLVILSPAQLPGVNYGQAYPGITLYATGGTVPYAWSVVSGPLPSGLSLSSSGVLTGGTLSSGAGAYSFTVQCADSAGHAVTQVCAIQVTNEPLQTMDGSGGGQLTGFSYYGVPESAVNPGNMVINYDMFESAWTPPSGNSSSVVRTQVLSGYDPGNWKATTQTNSATQSPPDTGTVYTGPLTGQNWYYGGYGYKYEPPLRYFNSITASYSHIAPPANGIAWNANGAQLYEFNFDIWLNSFKTEIMIWTYTVGARYPWGDAPASHNTGHGLASSYPVGASPAVSMTFPNGYNPYYGTVVTLPVGPGGSNVTYGFCYNIEADATTYDSGSGTSYLVPRGPFNFIQINPAGTAFSNTSSGFVNLWGPNGASGNGLLNWLVNNGFIDGSAPAGVPSGTHLGANGTSYTATFNSSNYGVEVCCTGGTAYPPLTFQNTSHTLLTDKTWAAQTVTPP